MNETLMCRMGLAPPVAFEAPLPGFFAGGSYGNLPSISRWGSCWPRSNRVTCPVDRPFTGQWGLADYVG